MVNSLVSNALSVTEFTKDGVTYGWAKMWRFRTC